MCIVNSYIVNSELSHISFLYEMSVESLCEKIDEEAISSQSKGLLQQKANVS